MDNAPERIRPDVFDLDVSTPEGCTSVSVIIFERPDAQSAEKSAWQDSKRQGRLAEYLGPSLCADLLRSVSIQKLWSEVHLHAFTT